MNNETEYLSEYVLTNKEYSKYGIDWKAYEVLQNIPIDEGVM